jgi:hypothetical protein
MTNEKVIEGNRLIAEFMELKFINWNNEYNLWVHKDFKEDFTDIENYSTESKFDWEHSLPQSEKLFYHTSPSWLIPVVAKIESTLANSNIPNYRKGYDYWMRRFSSCFWNIDELYPIVVECIDWYNKNK